MWVPTRMRCALYKWVHVQRSEVSLSKANLTGLKQQFGGHAGMPHEVGLNTALELLSFMRTTIKSPQKLSALQAQAGSGADAGA